jgi:LysM repeat protein
MAVKRKKQHLQDSGLRFFSWIIALTIISGNLNETFSLAEKEPAEIHIQVEAGDTLWRIAQDLNDTVFENAHDVRYLIYVIEEANGLKSAIIHPGQTLVVPLDL